MRAHLGPVSELVGRFTSIQVGAINDAYQDALDRLGVEAGRLDRRTALATCILALATAGEMDEARLCSRALAQLGRLPPSAGPVD